MANEKISAMPPAPEPFTGSELFPLVGNDGVNDSVLWNNLLNEIFNFGGNGQTVPVLNQVDQAGSQIILDGNGNVVFGNAASSTLVLSADGAFNFGDSAGDAFGLYDGLISLQNSRSCALTLSSDGSVNLDDSIGSYLNFDGTGSATMNAADGDLNLSATGNCSMFGADITLQNSAAVAVLQSDGSIKLTDGSGNQLYLDNASGLTLFSASGEGLAVNPSGVVNFDVYPTFTPGSFSGTVTTASLVGKTLTFDNGILKSFA